MTFEVAGLLNNEFIRTSQMTHDDVAAYVAIPEVIAIALELAAIPAQPPGGTADTGAK